MTEPDDGSQPKESGWWPAFRHAAATFLVVLFLMSIAAHLVFGDPVPGADRKSSSDLIAIAFIWLPTFTAAGIDFWRKYRKS